MTFVGAIHELNVVLVALAEPNPALPENAMCKLHPSMFFAPSAVCGPIVAIASDDYGEEVDVDEDVFRMLSSTPQRARM